jgi:hypothetical protein
MGDIFLLSLVAAANATLLAAVTVMLFLENPKRLLLGYLAGALLVSLTIGFVIVFVVHDSGATETAQSSLSPSMDVALGAIFLLVAYVLGSGRDERLKERRKAKKEGSDVGEAEKGPSKVEQLLGRGDARITFAIGVVFTLPGVAYLAALHDLQQLEYGTAAEVLVILGFNAMLLILLEIPLIGYFVTPERTVLAVQHFRAWLTQSSRRIVVLGAAGLGALLLVRGVIGLLT